MNLIQENTNEVSFFTSMLDTEKWLDIDLADYDWHISDIDGGWDDLADPTWITGDKLKKKLREHNYQFIWAVFSAFKKGTKPFVSNEPYADGNPKFWEGVPEKQLKNAIFEIVCWDSSATLFIGLPDNLGLNVINNAPGIKNLDSYNAKNNS